MFKSCCVYSLLINSLKYSSKDIFFSGILANNPLGYELYNTYFKPVISKPSKATLREIFQDNDQGDSGYVPD